MTAPTTASTAPSSMPRAARGEEYATPPAPVGSVKEVRLAAGTIHYREWGVGAPIVFVHGFLCNGELWRHVAPALATQGRCIVPDWPLGAHPEPMRADADLSPRGVARLVAEFLDALDLRGVTLVGNDTGGAICQLVIARGSNRVARLVLTNCDAFEHFPPPLLLPFTWGGRVPGFPAVLAGLLRLPPARRLIMALVAHRRPDPATLESWFAPLGRDRGVRRDLAKLLRAISNRDTMAAARAFPSFRQPVLLAWGEDDFLFPISDAERLQRAFPDARLARIARARCFVPEDQPERLTELIAAFLAETATPDVGVARQA